MLSEIVALLQSRPTFFVDLLIEHLGISGLSILCAASFGLVLGVVISEYEKLASPVLAFISIVYTVPSISMLGFLIPFSGIGNATAIITLTIYALLPMVRNTHSGISTIDETVLEVAKGMGSTDWQILYKIKIPLALPIIMSGLRNMAVMTIALTGIASFIGAGGLGVAVYRGITTNNTAMTLVGSLGIALLAFGADFLLAALERVFRRQKQTKILRGNLP